MDRRLILYDMVPLFVSWPLPPVWTALALAMRWRKYDGLVEFYVHVDGQEGHPPHRALAAVAPSLKDGFDDVHAEGVLEEFRAGVDTMLAFWDAFGFGGYATRDRGLLSWESERGPEKFMMMERS